MAKRKSVVDPFRKAHTLRRRIDILAKRKTAGNPLGGVGQRIRAIRLAKGFTLTELAEGCPMSKGYLSSIERGYGKADPTLSTLARIATALGVTLSQIIADSDVVGADPVDDFRIEEISGALRVLINDRKLWGRTPLSLSTIVWLARAPFQFKRDPIMRDFAFLLRALGYTDDY